jgi:hypothetical protein
LRPKVEQLLHGAVLDIEAAGVGARPGGTDASAEAYPARTVGDVVNHVAGSLGRGGLGVGPIRHGLVSFFKVLGLRQSRPDGSVKKSLRGVAKRNAQGGKLGGDLQGAPIFCLRVPAGTLSQAIKKAGWSQRVNPTEESA